MSFVKLGMDAIQEVLVLALMFIFIVVIAYSSIDWMYKISIGVLVFSLVVVATMANQALRRQREQEKKRLR